MSNVVINADRFSSLNNIVFNPKIKDKIFDSTENRMEIESGRLKFNQGGENYIKNAIFLGSHPNYGHWLFNHLGRLKYIKKITKDTQVIVQGTASQNQIDLLTYFGIEPANIHRTKTGITLNVGHLIIPQIPWHRLDGSGVWWSPSAISYLRNKLDPTGMLTDPANAECS